MTKQPAPLPGGWTRLQVSDNGAAADEVSTELISILDGIEVPIMVAKARAKLVAQYCSALR